MPGISHFSREDIAERWAESIRREEATRRELIEALDSLLDTLRAHDIESLSCDRDGETYCDCLNKRMLAARAALAQAKGETTE